MSFWIFILASIGLIDAAYILYKKLTKKKLVCFFGDDCDRVSKSKYGYVLGIPIEALGIGFYLSLLGIFTLSTLGVIAIVGVPLSFVVLFIAIPASLASLYLLFIQAVLKEWCEWCILSAVVNFLILALVLFG
ncbi:MAG: hypothetical protein O3C23_01895 [bacterium]|nr:hypothetical protein [bacterium]